MKPREAARVFKETQPQLDAVKDVERLNKQARGVLRDHMHAKGVTEYSGIRMREVPFEGWDDPKLREHLGDKVGRFRASHIRRFFDLVKKPPRPKP